MGEVVMFRPRKSLPSDSELNATLDQIVDVMDRERQRRDVVYGVEEASPDLQRILGLYPMFRLTHVQRARRCCFCGHRIAPLELHFVRSGSYVCQSGTCMEPPK
jgi:hypothetical protein